MFLSEVSGKQNSLFPLGPVIKCLLEFKTLAAFVSSAENASGDAKDVYLSQWNAPTICM